MENNLSPKSNLKVDSILQTQVVTAKTYPRNKEKALQEIFDLATSDPEIAAQCYYSLPPRPGQEKGILGPSVRLAEICFTSWGNIQCDSEIISNNGKQIIVKATCWDLETNSRISETVAKSIVDRQGKTYSSNQQMIAVAAACATAFRNSVFKIVPQAFIDKLYKKCIEIASGANEKDKMTSRLKKTLQIFEERYHVSEETILEHFHKSSLEELDESHLKELIGIGTSIKDGFISVEEAFGTPKIMSVDPQTGEITHA